MKYLRWILNIIQFVIVFFIAFIFLTEVQPLQELYDLEGKFGNSFGTLNAGISLIIAISSRKIYNKVSLFIMKIRISFFGYLPLKWKRLARVLSFAGIILLPVVFTALDIPNSYEPQASVFLGFITSIILIPVVSYTLKPFVVKD
tara:strand:- start:211 stop:645 length:435 start_codon:yes stop_codon:yes gene_type:complete